MRRVLFFLLFAATLSAAPFEWKTESGRTVLYENGKLALAYNNEMQLPPGVPEDRKRCCYIHPLATPAGVVITDDFPKDHYHHRGLFWAWPVVETGERKLDLWMMKGIRQVNVSTRTSVAGTQAQLDATNEWHTGERAVAREHVTLTVQPAQGHSRRMRLKIHIEALNQPVTIAGSTEAGKSYGGVGVRFAPRENTMIRADGSVLPKDDDLTLHSSAELAAVYEGKAATLRMSVPGAPVQWCLRHYGFIGPSFPGRTATVASYTIEPGKPLELTYSIEVVDGAH